MTNNAHITHKLVKENQELRQKLAIAEQWIGRELHEQQFRRLKEDTMRSTKNGLIESDEHMGARFQKYFGRTYRFLGQENRELLRESEVNFSHLLRQKDLDGFIVTSAYQKILENIFEEEITKHFRKTHKNSHLHPRKNDLLEKTLYKVIKNDFRLSLGKIYQILKAGIEENPPDLIGLFQETLEIRPIYEAFSHGDFWEYFTDIIETQAFGEKRHAGKITLKDARLLREKITGNFEKEGFLKIILEYLV